MNDLDQFLKQYEEVSNSHDFDNVAPLIAKDAVYWFTDGSYEGLASIREAFEAAWNTVKEEVYTISNVHCVAISEAAAACVYDFSWEGLINGEPESGGGRGTNVLVKTDDGWQIVHEHLSKNP